jgi:hypothetical protein
MKTLFVTDFTFTSPPSKGFVMLPETDADKLLMVEIIDLPECRRAPDMTAWNEGKTGRVMAKSLRAHLASEGASEGYGRAVLNICHKHMGESRDRLISSAFYVRFFQH